MQGCCENKADELASLRRNGLAKVLYAVLALNGAMFAIEFIAGWLVGSIALLGDSLDMFGDATVYALTLYALDRSERARAGATLVKGGFMLLFGVAVVVEAIHKSLSGLPPEADWMGTIGVVALAANTLCFVMLYRFRRGDLNLRSTWLCSRNDLVANASVIIAALLVALTQSAWPDVIVGLAIAALFLHTAWGVLSEAWPNWRQAGDGEVVDSHPGADLAYDAGANSNAGTGRPSRKRDCDCC